MKIESLSDFIFNPPLATTGAPTSFTIPASLPSTAVTMPTSCGSACCSSARASPPPPSGTLVVLDGLQSAAGRKLNGLHAFVTLTTPPAAASARIAVIPLPHHRNSSPIAVKSDALARVPNAADLSLSARAAYITGVHAHSARLLRASEPESAVAHLDVVLATQVFDNDENNNKRDNDNIEQRPTLMRLRVLLLRARALRAATRIGDAVNALTALLEEPELSPELRARAQCELSLTRLDDNDITGALDVVDDMRAAGSPGNGANGMQVNGIEDGKKDETDKLEDDDEEECNDDDLLSVTGALARAAHAAMERAMIVEDDALVRRSSEALLTVRARHVDATRALGYVLVRVGETMRGEELQRKADELEARFPSAGTLVRLEGLASVSGSVLNGRFAVVVPMEQDVGDDDAEDDVAVAVLPFDEGDECAQTSLRCAKPVGENATEWATEVAGQYVEAVTRCAGAVLQDGDGGMCVEMCEAARAAVGEVEVQQMGELMFVLWMGLRAEDEDERAVQVFEDVRSMKGTEASGVAERMGRVLKEERDMPRRCGGCCEGDGAGNCL